MKHFTKEDADIVREAGELADQLVEEKGMQHCELGATFWLGYVRALVDVRLARIARTNSRKVRKVRKRA